MCFCRQFVLAEIQKISQYVVIYYYPVVSVRFRDVYFNIYLN